MKSSRTGSEKDSIYCPFYQKIGSCMHGEGCSRMHIHPHASRTLLLCNFYPNPLRFLSLLPKGTNLYLDKETIDRNFDDFYLDVFEELRQFGVIEDFVIADNQCEHLAGNVLVKYERLEDAVCAFCNLRGRYYAGRPIDAQYSPVESFSNALCRQLKLGKCQHGENCNFIHPKYPSKAVEELCYLTGHDYEEENQIINFGVGKNKNQDKDSGKRKIIDQDSNRKHDYYSRNSYENVQDRNYDSNIRRSYDQDRNYDSNIRRSYDQDRNYDFNIRRSYDQDRDYDSNSRRSYDQDRNYDSNSRRSYDQDRNYDSNSRRSYEKIRDHNSNTKRNYEQDRNYRSDSRRSYELSRDFNSNTRRSYEQDRNYSFNSRRSYDQNGDYYPHD